MGIDLRKKKLIEQELFFLISTYKQYALQNEKLTEEAVTEAKDRGGSMLSSCL